jgi:hypothetical protein
MNPARDEKGRWPPGTSGNPKGRPRGAKDNPFGLCRLNFDISFKPDITPEQRDELTSRFGKYAQRGHGGPGRPRGSVGQRKMFEREFVRALELDWKTSRKPFV